ncbi:MAG TPA: hypothetical protein VFY10_11015 [Dehalococcoidia bacterium]|nr:hypothetical protein [Dehalococcoidia bacterium]
MNKTVVAVTAVVVGLVIIAGVAFAFGSGGGNDDSAQIATPTITTSPTPLPSIIVGTQTSMQTSTPSPSPTRIVLPVDTATAPAPTSTTVPAQPVSATPVGPGATARPAPPTPTLEPKRKAVPAPIDKLDIATLESFPAQYVAQIMAGLPDGCARPYTYSVEQRGAEIDITVLNSEPSGAVACTAIYGDYPLNVNLGSQFDAGTTYTVKVNDKTATFTAR